MSPPNHQSEGLPEQVLNIILDLDAEANRRASAAVAQQPQQPGTSGLQPANHGKLCFSVTYKYSTTIIFLPREI